MKRVLLLGSSYSAMPILSNLKARGAEVTVVGKHDFDPCHKYADRSIYADYSSPQSIEGQIDIKSFDHVVPTCNDYSYATGAQLSSRFGFVGFDSLSVVEVLHQKNMFRRFCAEHHLKAPRVFCEVNRIEDLRAADITYPVIVKPVDSFSGRGASVVEQSNSLIWAVDHALSFLRAGTAVIEEFVDGTLHSYSTFISSGNQIWGEVVDEYCDAYPYQVDGSKFPSILSEKVKRRVVQEIGKLVSLLSLTDGLLHTQFIVNGEDFWLIECMRRCPGDLFPEHFLLSGGINYWESYVSPFLGVAPACVKTGPPTVRVERRVVSSRESEAFYGVEIYNSSSRTVFFSLKTSGDDLSAAPFDKAGIVFCIYDGRTPLSDGVHLRRLVHDLRLVEQQRSSGMAAPQTLLVKEEENDAY